jgi:hypothetical protein
MAAFDEWRSGGTEIHWQSTTAANSGTDVTVFTGDWPAGAVLVDQTP